MRDAIITRKPFLPRRRKTDLALFAVCFLFLLFSAFTMSPRQGETKPQALQEQTASIDRADESCTSDDNGTWETLNAGERFLIADCSDLNLKRMTSRR